MINNLKDVIPTIVVKKGKQLLQMPNGDMIEGLIFTRVYDSVGDHPYVIAKILVNIKNTENDPS